MRRLAIFLVLLVALVVAGASGADVSLVSKEVADGANGAFSDCPPDAPPADGQICHDYVVQYLRFDRAVDGGAIHPRSAPFRASLEIFVSRYDAASDSFDLLALEVGDTTEVTGSYDETHLSFASMHAHAPIELLSIDLATGDAVPNGDVAVLGSMTWTAIGTDRFVFGNDGPGNDGLPRHFTNGCVAANFNAHQTIRPATLDATVPLIDGRPVAAPYRSDPEGAIFRDWFHNIVVVNQHC
jgi:hypothetical protein